MCALVLYFIAFLSPQSDTKLVMEGFHAVFLLVIESVNGWQYSALSAVVKKYAQKRNEFNFFTFCGFHSDHFKRVGIILLCTFICLILCTFMAPSVNCFFFP